MSDLPDGWVWTDAATLAEVQGGIQKQPKRTPSSNPYPFLRVANVLRGRLDLHEVHKIELFDGEIEKFRLRRGDLLVVEGNGSPNQIGRAARWLGEIEDCVHQNHLIRVRPTAAIDSKYLSYYWNAPQTTEYLRSMASSTSGLYVLTAAKVRGVRIPLPPMAEQKRIVVAIEGQFSRLDAGVAALDRVLKNFNRLRATVLRNVWNDAIRASDGVMIRVVDLLELPLSNGRSVPDGSSNGFPVLRLTCVRDGAIDPTKVKAGAWNAAEAAAYLIREGDFLVIRGNGSKNLVGRGGLVKTKAMVAYPDTLIRVRFAEKLVLSSFAALLWDSVQVRTQVESAARTTAGIYKINQRSLGDVHLPVPQLEIQASLVDTAQKALAMIARVTGEVERTSARVSALRASVLAAAFAGNFAQQDPTDEPASVLLERIAAERATSNGRQPARGSTPRMKVTP